MPYRKIVTFAVALLSTVGLPVGAAGIEGTWLVQEKSARIEIKPCDENLCGTIVWLSEPRLPDGRVKKDVENPDSSLRERTIVGLMILSELASRPDPKGYWRGGRIYDPESGKTYKCRASLRDADHLRLRGYLGFSWLGRTTTWTRVEQGTRAASAP